MPGSTVVTYMYAIDIGGYVTYNATPSPQARMCSIGMPHCLFAEDGNDTVIAIWLLIRQ